MKAIDKYKEIINFLKACGIETAEKEAEILLKQGADIDIVEMYRDNPEILQAESASIKRLYGKRSFREPLNYILGSGDFLDLRLQLGQGVLIPRPETELMALEAIKCCKDKWTGFTAFDLCTGSGCLALALAKYFPRSSIYASDISHDAIRYAKKNSMINDINNVSFFIGDLFAPISTKLPGQSFDLVITNPPYIKTDEIRGLQPEISKWEPWNALDGGKDGLDFYRKIIPSARNYLKNNGLLMLEIGNGQINDITDMIEGAGYSQIKIKKDLAGIERIVRAKWKNL
jgi:release factor glutamine methyltransferase